MKIALLGYGRMGKEIETIAKERNHEIVLIIDIDNTHELTVENLRKADVAIDFSTPSSAFSNILKCFSADVPVVCGTTGWLNRYNEVVDICKRENKSFFYTSNYSIGVNIFFTINRKLARLMNQFPEYEVSIEETHHIHKLDAPSGTAITIADHIIGELDRKKKWVSEKKTNNDSLKIKSIREGEVPGIHIVTYDSPVDSIELKHSAKSRKGLALGAMLAAEYIYKKTGVFTMSDLMKVE
jgi:4-hydroxy-tetrahydrodipicolinate reductase